MINLDDYETPDRREHPVTGLLGEPSYPPEPGKAKLSDALAKVLADALAEGRKPSEVLAEALADASAEEQRLEANYGKDQEDGAVIAFKVRFSPRRKPYSTEVPKSTLYDYAAIRTDGRWYTTGPNGPKAYTWIDLVTWLDSLEFVSPIQVLRTGEKPDHSRRDGPLRRHD